MATKQELEVRVVELEAQLAAAGSPTVDTSTLERDLEQASLSRDQWKAEAELQAKNVTDLKTKEAFDKHRAEYAHNARLRLKTPRR